LLNFEHESSTKRRRWPSIPRFDDTKDADSLSSSIPEAEKDGAEFPTVVCHGWLWASVSGSLSRRLRRRYRIRMLEWFHYGQAIMKRINKMGLKDAYIHDTNVREIVQSLFVLPLLPPADIAEAAQISIIKYICKAEN